MADDPRDHDDLRPEYAPSDLKGGVRGKHFGRRPTGRNTSRIDQVAEPRAKRADGQMTGLAGELFVAAELLKRGLQTSITFGNAKAVDLLAFNASTGRTFTVQVKALRKRTYFPIAHERVGASHIYVFVLLNKPGEFVQYFVVPGRALSDEPERFGKWFLDPKFPGIHPKSLTGFADAWELFDEPAAL